MSILTPVKPPYIEYSETASNPLINGDGAQIPVFIGTSNNTGNPSELKVYKNYTQAKTTVANGGLGLETETLETDNPLLFEIKQFFIESTGTATNRNDIGVPRVYAIDLGQANAVTNEKIKNALEEIKKVREIEVVAFVGLEKDLSSAADNDAKELLIKNQVALMRMVNTNLVEDTSEGRFKIAYFRSRKGASDTEIASYSNTPQTLEKSINEVRICINEYPLFGKTIARICTTPYYEEPGYGAYSTVELGEFTARKPEERQALFDAGIIFGEDEYRLETPVPRICAGTSTAFGSDLDERPNDCLLHARRNADHQMREILKIIAPQLKRNETATNILYVEADCEAYLAREKDLGRLMDYSITVEESDSNPYDLLVYASITPVNSTYAIDISCYVASPYTDATDLI